MAGAKGSALEWALALLQAPGERHALRGKPLPPGIDELLAVAAGGSPEALTQAARRHGVDAPRLREAAQFYAREVLFFPQADAYRTLGVAHDATPEQIKTHHRLLQHWLHPDRLQGEDDAVFAGRINSAWNRLRTTERRQAYDDALREQRPPELFDSNGAMRALPAWEPLPPPPSGLERWRHRVPGLLLGAACLVLATMVLQDMGRSPESWEEGEKPVLGKLAENLGIRAPEPRKAKPDTTSTRKPESPAGNRTARIDTAPAPSEARVRATPLPTPLPEVTPAAPPPAVALQAPTPAPAAAKLDVEGPRSTPQPPPTPVVLAAESNPAPMVPTAQPPSRRNKPTDDPHFVRIQSARQVGDQLLRYMAATNRPPPPIWNSPAIQSSVDQLRQDLHQAGRPDLSDPRWRIGNDVAVMTTGFKAGDAASGSLTADLIWREGHWLVTGLSVERTE
ncbi:hypothetical protein MASR1M8_12410 [Thermomonas brevis]